MANDLFLVNDGYAKPHPYFAKSFEQAMEMFVQDNYEEEEYCNMGDLFRDDPIVVKNSKGDKKKFTCSIERIYKYNVSEVK